MKALNNVTKANKTMLHNIIQITIDIINQHNRKIKT